MDSNKGATPKPTMKKGHPNPERLDQTIEIIEAPSKVFVVASMATLVSLGVWSIVAEIPSTVPAQAVFIVPQSIKILQATGNGRFFFKDDLSTDTSKSISSFISLVTRELREILNNPSEITSEQQSKEISESINNFFRISTEATNDIEKAKISYKDQVSSNTGLQTGEIYGYILNEQTALNFASQLATYSQQNLYSNLAVKSNDKLLNQGNMIDNALSKRVVTIQELAKQGIVSQSTVLQAKQQVLQQNQTNISQALSLQSTKSDKSEGLSRLLGNIVASTEGIQLKAKENIQILSKLVSSGTSVTANQNVAIATTSQGIPYIISCFIPGLSFSGVKKGAKVLVSPVNVDQNKYGSIIGTIEDVSNVGLGPDDAKTLIGVPSILSTIYSKEQTLFYATVRLRKANNFTGYQWSSSNGPNFRIPQTTTASVQIVTDTYRPYQVVLPFLKSITGN